MGQIFDRLKFIARTYINSLKEKAKKHLSKTNEPDHESSISFDDNFNREWEQFQAEQEEFEKNQEKLRANLSCGRTNLENAYKILDLSFGSDLETVKKKYRDLIKCWHPDATRENTCKESEDRFRKIHEAYITITNYLQK